MNFEERKKIFQEKIIEISQKYKINIYPTNVVLPNGEVMPSIKMADNEPVKVVTTKTNEDTTKK